MKTKTFATRMTCFSLISAIETDLRNVISNMSFSNKFDIPADVIDKAKKRYNAHYNEKFIEGELLDDLLDFSDFSDISKIISKNKIKQNTFSNDELAEIVNGLNHLVQVRNRVCHSRPLEYNDVNELTDFSHKLINIGSRHWWGNINEALSNLDNPTFALSLQIPAYWNKTASSIVNNLPLPEFDDTGFLGRKTERNAVNELIYSHTRVISLIGEGGVGKTALALRCLYDVLEYCENTHDSPFDIIIWVTLKANRLTSSGVIQLRDAIVSSLGLYQNIGENLGINSDNNIEELLEEISLYMKEFKILLCIDNLETLEKQEVRGFLASIPEGSKVVITTRVGLGEVEYRYKLDKLDLKSAVDLIRKLSKLLNIDSLAKKNTSALNDLARRLHNNPLLIKWYVLSIGSGQSREDILNKESTTYKEALKFCFQNLYEKLSETELEIVKTITCLRNSISAVELRFFLSDKNEIEIAEALHNLNNSSMLKSEVMSGNQSDGIRNYTLTNIANDYLSSVSRVEDGFVYKIREKNKELRRHIEEGVIDYNHYHLDVTHIHTSNKDEKICAVYLKRALKSYRKEESIEEALDLVKKAKQMMPEFSECYRINAYFLQESPYDAEFEYKSALEYNPTSIITRYSYSQFLMKEEEYSLALDQINSALDLDGVDNSLLSFKALILTRSGDYKGASEIYEKILPEQSENEHRKFRISTYQQVIECYKRYAERLIIDKDFHEAEIKLRRAIDVFGNAFSTQNYDERMIFLYCRLICEVDKVDDFNQNINLGCEAINTIEAYSTVFSFHQKISLSSGIKEASDKIHSRNKEKWLHIAEDLIENRDETGHFEYGIIKELNRKNGNNISFGFISGDDGEEYFFHRGEITPPNALDNIGEYKDTDIRVSYVSSIEPRGPSAKKVRLL